MSANIEAKKQVVEDIKAKISASKSVVLVDYKGLTVAEDTAFRNEFRKAGVQYKVLKNTLVRYRNYVRFFMCFLFYSAKYMV